MLVCWLLVLLALLPHEASAVGSVSVNIKDLGAIDGLQSLDIRGANKISNRLKSSPAVCITPVC